MAKQSSNGAADTTSAAQGRFTVQLPSSVRGELEAIGVAVSAAVEAQTGVGVDLSLAQIVTALIKARHAELAAAESAAEQAAATAVSEAVSEANGSESPEGDGGAKPATKPARAASK